MNIITSTKNPEVRALKDLIKRSDVRKKKNIFIAEGVRLVEDIIKSNMPPIKLYITEELLRERNLYIDYETVKIGDRVLNYLSDTKSPQGIIGIFKRPKYSSDDIFKGNPLLLILEDIRDPGNMGTIFRSFEAAGGTGIVLLNSCTDPFSPKCIRATMGSIVRLPFICCSDIGELKEIIDLHKNLNIYAADMNGKSLYSMDYTLPTAFVIGNEARGVSKDIGLLTADTVSIPMKGSVESLNAAVSASIISFEAQRQRLGADYES